MLDHESSQLTNAPIRGAVQSAPPTQKRFCQDGFDLTNAWLLANRSFNSTDIARLEWYEEVKADAAALLRSHNLACSLCSSGRASPSLRSRIRNLLLFRRMAYKGLSR